MAPLSKEQSRAIRKELRKRLNKWDPIGLIAMGCPDDEYDCLVGHVMVMLVKDAQPQDLTEFLLRHIPEHFGVAPPNDVHAFCEDTIQWFAATTRLEDHPQQ